MIGALSTQAHVQVGPYLNDPDGDGNTSDGVPDLFVSTGWSGWGDAAAYPWTIGFIPDYASDGLVLGRHITAEFPDGQIGLLYQDDEFGRDYRTALESLFSSERLLSQPYPPEDTDISQEIGALVDFGAQVIVLAAPPEIAAAAIRAARGGGADPAFLLSYINQPSNLASDLGGGASAQAIISGFQQLDGVLLTSYLLSAVEDERSPAVIEHVRIMETYDGPDPSSLSIYGQALAETVVETLDRACPDLTRSNVIAAAESLDGFRPSLMLPGITIKLSDTDHLAVQALQVWRINGDGTLTPEGDPLEAVTPSPSP
jgi:branched-chain amino acid transport system substrate-binding protein